MLGAMSWVARYRRGEHEAVWDEIVAEGLALRNEPERGADAAGVAAELMRRAGRNVLRIREALDALGYRFEAKDAGHPTTCTRRTSAAECRTGSTCPTAAPTRRGATTTSTPARRSSATCARRCSIGPAFQAGRVESRNSPGRGSRSPTSYSGWPPVLSAFESAGTLPSATIPQLPQRDPAEHQHEGREVEHRGKPVAGVGEDDHVFSAAESSQSPRQVKAPISISIAI